MSAPQADIGHNSGASRKAIYIAEITKAMQARKDRRLEEALGRADMGALSSTDRIIALKHGLLDNYRVLYATFPNMDVLPGVVLFVSIFSDNGDGCCTYAMGKMARYFSRSERAIRDALHRAVECGTLNRQKPAGGRYSHWPVVFRSILDPASSPTWFVDAALPIQGDTGSRLPVRQPDTPEAGFRYHRKPDAGDHRKPDNNVFPRKDIQEGSPPASPGKSHVQPHSSGGGENQKWLQSLNPEAAARKAFAVSQVAISQSGKVTIGPELHAELRKDFTESQIERGLEKAARYMEGGPEKRMASVRTACGWAKDDDRKASSRAAPKRTQPPITADQDREFADALERARLLDEEDERCRR